MKTVTFNLHTLGTCMLVALSTCARVLALDVGDGRHGDLVIEHNITVEELYNRVRLSTDPAVYNPTNPAAIPCFRRLAITNSATVSPEAWDGSSGGWIALKVQDYLRVEAGSSISCSGRGYHGGQDFSPGDGPGGGGEGFSSGTGYRGGGGGYGTPGESGQGNRGDPNGGGTYGEGSLDTIFRGSGGGSMDGSGGAGGGIVVLDAGSLVVEGGISANGSNGGNQNGGGSGGSILLCGVHVSGSSVSAVGGDGPDNGGAGGDGRIRMDFGSLSGSASTPAAYLGGSVTNDLDGDSIPDVVDWGTNSLAAADSDADGVFDYLDTDSDNDGIPDQVEAGPDPVNPRDSNTNGVFDFRELDSDGDGIPDSVECGPDGGTPRDTDGDGLPDFTETDSDADGIPDAIERGPDGTNPRDSDGDGVGDYAAVDSDADGIPDNVEMEPDGVPYTADSDGDFIPDYWEDFAGMSSTDPTDAGDIPPGDELTYLQKFALGLTPVASDTDGDGISDADEVGVFGTNPLSADTDHDGMPDQWEIDHGLNPLLDDSQDDSDFDFLTNIEEYEAGLAPSSPDSNGDGTNDYQQVRGGTTWAAMYDRNNRLLGVRHERGASFGYRYDGNGNLIGQAKLGRDEDQDGLPDLWEYANGLDYTSAEGVDGPWGDADGDGWSNIQELNGGSSVGTNSSVPGADGVSVGVVSAAFVPDGFVVARSSEESLGVLQIAVAASGDPGGETNSVRLFTEGVDGWKYEDISVGSWGVTSLAIGKIGARPLAVYAALSKPGARGRVVQLQKNGAVWEHMTIVESLRETALIHGFSGEEQNRELLVGISSPLGPDGALYRVHSLDGRLCMSALDLAASQRGPGVVLKPGRGREHESVLRLLDAGGVQLTEPRAYPTLDNFNDGIVPFLDWTIISQTDPDWRTSASMVEEDGLLKMNVSWGNGSYDWTVRGAQADLVWPSEDSGLLIKLAVARHYQPEDLDQTGNARVLIGSVVIYDCPNDTEERNVEVQVIRGSSSIYYRHRVDGGAWGSWTSGASSSTLLLEARGQDRLGVDSQDAFCQLHVNSVRFVSIGDIIGAGRSKDDLSGLEAAYRASNGTWYFRNDNPMTWTASQMYAFERGGDLAGIGDAELNTWLAGKFSGEHWVGRYRTSVTSDWTWADCASSSYANWATNQPGSSNDQLVVGVNTGKWFSSVLTEPHHGIWSVDTNASRLSSIIVPEPSSTGRLEWIGRNVGAGFFNPSSTDQVSVVQAYVEDVDGSGTLSDGDEFTLAETIADATTAEPNTLYRKALNGVASVANSIAVVPAVGSDADLLVIGEPDGELCGWVAPTGGGTLQRNVLSLSYYGQEWHALGDLPLPGGNIGMYGVAVSPASPREAQLIIWDGLELGATAIPEIQASAPTASVLAAPSTGGAAAPLAVRIWDNEGNLCSLTMQFKDAAGGDWLPASLVSINGGDPGTAQLSSSSGGTSHSVIWNARLDIGSTFDGPVWIRARASDWSGTGDWSAATPYSIVGNRDTDGDGLPDDWEQRYFGDPTNAVASVDSDEDGHTNEEELRAGTRPNDPDSVLRLLDVQNHGDDEIVIYWATETGKVYAIERSTNLVFGFWALTDGIPATPPQNVYTDATPSLPAAFYEIRLED